MRSAIALGVVALCFLSQGCGLAGTACRVLTDNFCEAVSDCRERARNDRWADEAWRAAARDATCPLSKDYEDGFHEGFTEHLYRGGNGEPPPVPPNRYRALGYETPEGYAAITNWFAGYRHGARVAERGGYRRLVTGPSSLSAASAPAIPDPTPPPAVPVPATVPELPPTPNPMDSPGLAPAPVKTPAATPLPPALLPVTKAETPSPASPPNPDSAVVFMAQYKRADDLWLVTFTSQTPAGLTTLAMPPGQFAQLIDTVRRLCAETPRICGRASLRISNGKDTATMSVDALALRQIADYLDTLAPRPGRP
jgi:hypothetical protein